ncbi:MAG: DEAD/DEAH box helicase family protein, partial [Bacteroidaceae bacterium]|nr:DEAD/DEAH box helicase family protein [Bacteroidaceae bacterium]
LELFSKSEFDYIIIDECHHATAKTYQDIINYFEPEFLLGLTATPERKRAMCRSSSHRGQWRSPRVR